MDLVAQFIAMGMTPEQAQEYAENFVKGLQELGVTDNPDPTQVPTMVPIPDPEPVPDPTPAPAVFTEAPAVPEPIGLFSSKGKPTNQLLVEAGVKPIYAKLYSAALDKAFVEANISTPKRKAMFLAQVLHESRMLTTIVENLNYSEQGLVTVFGRYFDRNIAKNYARNPQKIANHVYANRMGNGSESSGDGWRYKGRGLIQLTGKENYIAAGKAIGVDLVKNPDYLTTPDGAARSAGWFWTARNLNKSADNGDIKTNTRLINGGYQGLTDRVNLYQKISKLI